MCSSMIGCMSHDHHMYRLLTLASKCGLLQFSLLVARGNESDHTPSSSTSIPAKLTPEKQLSEAKQEGREE